MSRPYTLFEVSWEVCNKVGGIHTVVSTKAKTLVERLGDDYVAIGPWLVGHGDLDRQFEDSPGFEPFTEACRQLDVPVRVGRWRIPGAPRTILVEFSRLIEKKDGILSGLWERYGVDSLTGGWDYTEPLLFGHAAALVIERWYQEFCAGDRRPAVAQFHEWMTGSGALQLKHAVPAIGTVFTTHATVLGRALSSTGWSPESGLGDKTAAQWADELGVRSKHSIEGVCAREADVFTTVSEITAGEAEVVLGRRADPLLPNGIDLAVIDELRAGVDRAAARSMVREFAHRFLGESMDDAALVAISGRYEFHNKGVDVFLDALGALDHEPGRPIVAVVMIPAGQSGVSRSLQERLRAPLDSISGALGISTHNLFEPENDPVLVRCKELGLDNHAGSRVKVIQIPIYFGAGEGLFGLPYEAVLGAFDLSVFPSFYEPWGYTPEESLAVGVPTITSDHAGFGRWARAEGLGPADGVIVLDRVGRTDAEAAADLARAMAAVVAEPRDEEQQTATCRRTAERTAWRDLIAHYDQAFDAALAASETRRTTQLLPALPARFAVPITSKNGAPHLTPFDVSATLPRSLQGLRRLATNYWWSWDPEGRDLFEQLSPRAWDAADHNPLALLQLVFPEDLEARATDAEYVARLRRVTARFDAYMGAARSSYTAAGGGTLTQEAPAVYLCAEFGVHESLRIYSGGLGILAGDHLKSASDLNFPLVAVGLFYREGYLRQRLTAAGEQIALPAPNDPQRLPMELVRDGEGRPLEVELGLPSARLILRAWLVRVGRVKLYLLDSDVEANHVDDRAITSRLYGGDVEARLRQEIVLGRGGQKLLAALGLRPSVYHVNEGHAAFVALQRVSELVHNEGLTFDEARELVRASTVFTTHTPVPAGHDRFDEDLLRRYFAAVPNWIGIPWERFLALGQDPDGSGPFNMTYLALTFSAFVNGVSRLHGEVSRELLKPYWPKLLEGERPVQSITNGVHLATWASPALGRLLGAVDRPVSGQDFAERADALDPAALWAVRERAREHLLNAARERLTRAFEERHDRPAMLARMLSGLREDALVIGFARRFAPYKRAALLFRDEERLARILQNEDRPVLFLFAGKAHPADQAGKDLLRSIVERSRREPFLGHVLFLDDYDVELGREMVQGVDVWLNNPTRPLEASGTSGMKVAANGGLNLSVLDGWWCEGFDGANGWAIERERRYEDQELQDELDAEALYTLLEEEVVPLFFERDADGLPRQWLERVVHNLKTLPAEFDTDRMVAEYRDRAYLPLAGAREALSAEDHRPLQRTVDELQRLRRGFEALEVREARVSDLTDIHVGDRVGARLTAALGDLAPEDVRAELVLGHGREGDELHIPMVVPLAFESSEGGVCTFAGSTEVKRSGQYAYGLRLRPANRFDFPGLIGALDRLAHWA